MSQTNFAELLNTKTDDIERPKPVPPGTYLFSIKEFKFDNVGQNQNPACIYTFQFLLPDEDVDQDEFQEFGGQPKLASRTHRETFWLTPDAMFRLKDFLAILGETSGRTLQACISESVGQQFKATISHRMGKARMDANGNQIGETPIYTDISGYQRA